MLTIAISLLIALILSWFGFDKVVIKGVYELFNKEITKTGYYFIFGMFGMLRSLLLSTSSIKRMREDIENSKKSIRQNKERKHLK